MQDIEDSIPKITSSTGKCLKFIMRAFGLFDSAEQRKLWSLLRYWSVEFWELLCRTFLWLLCLGFFTLFAYWFFGEKFSYDVSIRIVLAINVLLFSFVIALLGNPNIEMAKDIAQLFTLIDNIENGYGQYLEKISQKNVEKDFFNSKFFTHFKEYIDEVDKILMRYGIEGIPLTDFDHEKIKSYLTHIKIVRDCLKKDNIHYAKELRNDWIGSNR
ncbi:hypothetical protein Q7M41_05175 [Candidatus Liberibacter asiaticus]